MKKLPTNAAGGFLAGGFPRWWANVSRQGGRKLGPQGRWNRQPAQRAQVNEPISSVMPCLPRCTRPNAATSSRSRRCTGAAGKRQAESLTRDRLHGSGGGVAAGARFADASPMLGAPAGWTSGA